MTPNTQPSASSPKPWILVVDDEPSIRTLIEFVLRSEEWSVQAANGHDEAMAILDGSGSAPSLVVCDVLMPGIDGLELARRLCARIKGLNVLFISGHLTDVSWWPEDLRDHRFLPKPFENAQLLAAVNDAITGSST